MIFRQLLIANPEELLDQVPDLPIFMSKLESNICEKVEKDI